MKCYSVSFKTGSYQGIDDFIVADNDTIENSVKRRYGEDINFTYREKSTNQIRIRDLTIEDFIVVLNQLN